MYIRLSNEDSDIAEKTESNSILNQKDMIYDYISKENELANYEIVEYVDDGFSGTNTNRTAFKKLLKDARDNTIKCIVVKDLSRFSRNYIEAGNFLEQVFPFLGIRFISINDSYDSESFNGTTGGFEIAFKNLLYDLYSKDLSKKVKAGKEIKMRKGEYLGSFAPFGYKKSKIHKHKLEISEKEAEVVKLIFNLRYYENKSISDIARELNLRKIKTPSMFFKERVDTKKFRNSSDKLMWSYGSIIRTIKNRTYTGAVVGRKRVTTRIGTNKSKKGSEEENIIVENVHEPIISKEIFETVNLHFNRKRDIMST
jgi:DNA invertase Pin-like site-specific DNA recombinase